MDKDKQLYVYCALLLFVLVVYFKIKIPNNNKSPLKLKIIEEYYEKPSTKQGKRDEIGRAGWVLLHNIAAKYPHKPEKNDIMEMEAFINLFGKLFPCAECSGHFQNMIKEFKPNLNSNLEFNLWLCQAHNRVNKRVGKPQFDCNRLQDRWDCGCEAENSMSSKLFGGPKKCDS